MPQYPSGSDLQDKPRRAAHSVHSTRGATRHRSATGKWLAVSNPHHCTLGKMAGNLKADGFSNGILERRNNLRGGRIGNTPRVDPRRVYPLRSTPSDSSPIQFHNGDSAQLPAWLHFTDFASGAGTNPGPFNRCDRRFGLLLRPIFQRGLMRVSSQRALRVGRIAQRRY